MRAVVVLQTVDRSWESLKHNPNVHSKNIHGVSQRTHIRPAELEAMGVSGSITLTTVVNIFSNAAQGTPTDPKMIWVQLNIEGVTGWIRLQKLRPGPQYTRLREKYPVLPIETAWPT